MYKTLRKYINAIKVQKCMRFQYNFLFWPTSYYFWWKYTSGGDVRLKQLLSRCRRESVSSWPVCVPANRQEASRYSAFVHLGPNPNHQRSAVTRTENIHSNHSGGAMTDNFRYIWIFWHYASVRWLWRLFTGYGEIDENYRRPNHWRPYCCVILNPGRSAPSAGIERDCKDMTDVFSISKFIADMHVEIWWSRKICFLYKRVFSVQLRSCLYLDAHVWPSSLQHIPLGWNYTTSYIEHHVSSWNSQQ